MARRPPLASLDFGLLAQAGFLTQDEKGRRLPQYLQSVAQQLSEDQRSMLEELQSLTQNVEHIKTVVGMQQEHARFVSMVESVALPELLETQRDRWAALPDFTKEALEAGLRALAEERGVKAGVLIHPVRMALSGATGGPPLFASADSGEVRGARRLGAAAGESVLEELIRALEPGSPSNEQGG